MLDSLAIASNVMNLKDISPSSCQTSTDKNTVAAHVRLECLFYHALYACLERIVMKLKCPNLCPFIHVHWYSHLHSAAWKFNNILVLILFCPLRWLFQIFEYWCNDCERALVHFHVALFRFYSARFVQFFCATQLTPTKKVAGERVNTWFAIKFLSGDGGDNNK